MGLDDLEPMRADGAAVKHRWLKKCSKCGEEKDIQQHFSPDRSAKSGYRSQCKQCRRNVAPIPGDAFGDDSPEDEDVSRANQPLRQDFQEDQKRQDQKRRLESDHEPLRVEDWDVTVGNDGKYDPKASKEKRQDFSRSMGTFARNLARDELDEKDGRYVGGLAEQEQRFARRRTARTVSLLAAHEALALRNFKAAARDHFGGKIVASGYATRAPKRCKRSVVLFLSDLHIGAELSPLDNPVEFRALQESRRLEFLIRQAVDYKPQYRADSELVLLLGGDLIEGLLLHDLRDGSPLTEQMIRFWKYFSAALALFAKTFPSVRVICQPGNHGRNVLRHPGRATSSKWDGVEFQMYYALFMMASGLRNVTFDLGFRAVSVVDLYGARMLFTHGDTEIKLGHPDRAAEKNATELAKINATGIYGGPFDVVAVGHFHTPRLQPGSPTLVTNGMLVPPNGHARTSGYITEQCGQWLWEAVEGYPVGDARYLRVGTSQDTDERLGAIIKPYTIGQAPQ